MSHTAQRPAFAPWLAGTNRITRGFLAAGRVAGLINLGGGLPAPELYPAEEIAALAADVMRDHPARTFGYGPVEGFAEFREVLARRFSTDRLRLGPENVIVTTSGVQALDLIGKVLIAPGQVVACQQPTYLGAIDSWKPRAPAYRAMDLAAPDFDPVTALRGAQFGYVVPNFSNPTGRLVPLERRRALVKAAQETGTWLVEDDPYGSLFYDGAPVESLLSLAGTGGAYDGPVVYLGTLSKELAPGLRIGWIIAAPELIEALIAAKQGSDMCTSGLTQGIAMAAMATGLTARMTAPTLALYRDRRDALLAAMDRHLAPWFTWDRPVGGMFVWATARDPGMDTDALFDVALAEGVCVSPSSVFDPLGRDRRSLRLNFTLNPPDRLDEACRRLAVALAKAYPVAA